MTFSAASLLPLGVKLGALVQSAIEQYVALRASGVEMSADVLTAFLLVKMEGWAPTVAGRRVLVDDDTRTSFARALAGIAIDISRGV